MARLGGPFVLRVELRHGCFQRHARTGRSRCDCCGFAGGFPCVSLVLSHQLGNWISRVGYPLFLESCPPDRRKRRPGYKTSSRVKLISSPCKFPASDKKLNYACPNAILIVGNQRQSLP